MRLPRLLTQATVAGDNTCNGADILNRIAKALELTTDFLMNGTMHNKSEEAISDEELLLQFRKVEKLPEDKKRLVKEFLDAFIFKADLQKQLAN